MNNNSNVIGRVSATITQKLTNSKFFKNTVSTFVAISMVLVALPFLSMAGFNPINLSEQKAEAGLVCPPGYFTDANTGCIQHLQKVTTCPDGSTAGGGNVCSTGQNKAWNCNSNIAGQQLISTGDIDTGALVSMCTSAANASQFIQGVCNPQFHFSSTTPGETFYNTTSHRVALGMTRMLNYTTQQVNVIQGGNVVTLNGQSANAQFCQPNACPAGTRIFVVEAKSIHYYASVTPSLDMVCVNISFIGETNPADAPIFTIAGGNSGSGSFDEFACGDGIGGAPGAGMPTYLAGTNTAFGNQYSNNHNEVNWVCIRPNYVSSNTGCPASHPNDVGQPAPFVCRANNFTYDNSGADFWVNDATTPGTGTCTPPTVAQAGGTATCTFPLSGAPTGATYTLGGLPPITATVGSGQSNPCTVSGSNLVCTGVPANNSQPIGVNTVSLSMGAGTASLTLTTPLTPAQVAALAVSCALAQTNSTTTCTFTLPVGYTLPAGTQITIGNGAAGGTCTAVGQLVTCTGVPTGTGTGNQPIGVVIGGVNTPSGETVGIATSPLLPSQVPALAVSCALAQTNSTTTCTFTLPVGYTLPAGTQISIGNGAAGGTCTAVGQLVTCTGVPTGTGTGNQPIGVVIGGVNTPSGETVGIATSPLLPSQVPALAVSCALAQTNSTTTCTFTLPVGYTLPAGTQISIGNGAAGGTCTAVGQLVTCTGVPTGTGTGNQPIGVVIGGVNTPSGETVGIATSPLLPSQVPALTVTCVPAGAYSTTTCTFTLPDGVSIPAGTQIQIGNGGAGGVCTSVGQVVTCTGVPTGTGTGAQPISVVIGGVTTASGESATINPAATPLPSPSPTTIDPNTRQTKTLELPGVSTNGSNQSGLTYPVTFSNGDTADLEILNSNTCASLGGITETKIGGKNYIEFRADCDQVIIKTYWNSLDTSKSYLFQKVNKTTGAQWENFPAVLSVQERNGKNVIVSVHTVNDNQAGDSDSATTKILDPYTMVSRDGEEVIEKATTASTITTVTKTVRTGGDQILKVSISAAIIALIGLAFKVSRKGQLKQLD